MNITEADPNKFGHLPKREGTLSQKKYIMELKALIIHTQREGDSPAGWVRLSGVNCPVGWLPDSPRLEALEAKLEQIMEGKV